MSVGAPSSPPAGKLDEELFQVQNHALIRAVLGNISEGVSIADLTGRFLYTSPFARWVFNVSDDVERPEEWVERYGIFLPDGKTPLPVEQMPLWRALKGEEVRDVDMFLRNPNVPDGLYIRTNCLPLRDEQGRQLGALVLVRSIDQERRSEAERKSAEAKFQQLVETAHEGVWTADAEGRTTYVNRFLANLLGYSIEEMLGRPIFDFMDEEAQREAARQLELRRQGHPAMLELRQRHKDGSAIWVQVNASPLQDEQGRYIGSLAMLSDISRRRAAEEEVRRLNQELERRIAERTAQLEFSNRELEAFAYTVAHDLRAPLRSITSFSDAILEDCPGQLDAVGQDYLKRIIGGARRMADLIDGILTLSRVNSTSLILREVDLSAIARSVLEQLQAQQPERRITLQLQKGLVAQGDPQLMRAVLENLLGNAWKFTRKRPEARIEFSATNDARGVRVYQVRDNGAGFDMTYGEKLFGVFQRLHTQQEFEGTGVGLATAQRIIRRHGGRIWGEGQPGQGACFSFTLHELPLPFQG
ncbi:MAG: PAS domain S-box protein [Myxococcaceae bacterium]|nr:PAS domain S-box protein [Myxococcaceae bacterium]